MELERFFLVILRQPDVLALNGPLQDVRSGTVITLSD